jgi:AraC family transcriptional regulator
MKYSNGIPLLRSNGELVPSDVFSHVVQSSAETGWKDVVLEEHRIPSNEWPNLMYKQHVMAVNVGRAVDCEFKNRSRFHRLLKVRGTISFFPSCQPFFLRVNMGLSGVADLIFLALDPEFVTRTAEKFELKSDRLELVEQRREYDPTLLHLALALREGVRGGAAADPLYGDALSTALALHLLREYTTVKPRVREAGGKLPRQTLLRAVEYIQDHLGKDLTVSRIADEVCISPYYFSRLFKEATGKSPYQFVIEARVSKAKQLLETGNIAISDAACEVGFADQSHLTRHFKRMFGLPPQALLRRRKSDSDFNGVSD